jgi:tetratricopeptide (TPR) repeat protein
MALRRLLVVAIVIGCPQAGKAADPPSRPRGTAQPAAAPGTPADDAAIAKAKELRAAGKRDEALDVLRVAAREVKKAAGETAPALLPIYEIAADLLVDAEEFGKAEALLEKATGMHRGLLAAGTGGDPAGYGRTLLVEARLHQAESRLQLALAAAKQSLLLLDAYAGTDAPETLRAGDAFSKAVAALGELLGPHHESALMARAVAADVEESLGRLPQAIALRTKAVAELRARVGSGGAATRAEADRLTRLLLAAGRATEGLEAQQARVAATDGSVTPADMRLLGELFLALERFTEAEAAYETALVADRAALGDTHPHSLLDRLASMHVGLRSGRRVPRPEGLLECVAGLLPRSESDVAPAEAVAGLLVAAEIFDLIGDGERSRTCGLQAQRAAEAHDDIPEQTRIAALVAAARTRAAPPGSAARAALEAAVRAAEQRLGAGHPATHLAVLALAEAAIGGGDAEAAAALVDRLLTRGIQRRDAASEERLVGLVDRVAEATGGADGSPRERLVTLRAAQFGGEHAHTGLTLALLGGRRCAAEDFESAAALCRRAIAIQEAALGADHPEVAAASLVLAMALASANQPATARPAFERALAIWDRTADPRHPVTLVTIRGLTQAVLAGGDTAAALPLLERLHAAQAADADPIDSARILVRMSLLAAAAGEGQRSRDLVDKALALPCWQQPPYADQAVLEPLALTMAEIARVYKTIEDANASTEALRRARDLAMRLASPRETLARIDATLERSDVAADPL